MKPCFILFFAVSIVFAQENSTIPNDILQQSKVSTLPSNILERAIDSLKLEIEKKPNAWKLYFDIGAGYMAIGNNADALQAFNRALELKGSDYAIKYKIAYLYYCMDSFEIAKNKFEELIKQHPDKIRLYEWIIDLYAILDNSEELIATYEQYCKTSDIYSSAGLGMIYALTRDYKKAIEFYEKTTDYNNDSWSIIAMLYLKSGDTASAERSLKNYIQDVSNYRNIASFLSYKSVAYYRLNKLQKAKNILEALIATNQADEIEIYNLGVFEIASADTAGLVDIRRACNIDTTRFIETVYEAMLAIRSDSIAAAESFLRQGEIRRLTTSGIANGLLAYCLEKQGKQLSACKYYLNCYGLTPLGTDIESIRSYIMTFVETLKQE